jgi:hypothetical protein
MSKGRITLFHWNAAEGEELACRLRKQGYEVELKTKVVPPELKAMAANPPNAVIIGLDRLPSHGRELAGALRRQKSTRPVPIVFAGGDPEKVEGVKALLPDAFYTTWPRIGSVLKRAFNQKPAKPVVPGVMAGYSGTPLPKKLGIKTGSAVALIGAPADFLTTLGALPDGVHLLEPAAVGGANVVLLFVTSQAALDRGFVNAVKRLAGRGALWIVWPKKASGIVTDVTENVVRAYGLARSFVDYKICAVDETWSGLCFARRK